MSSGEFRGQDTYLLRRGQASHTGSVPASRPTGNPIPYPVPNGIEISPAGPSRRQAAQALGSSGDRILISPASWASVRVFAVAACGQAGPPDGRGAPGLPAADPCGRGGEDGRPSRRPPPAEETPVSPRFRHPRTQYHFSPSHASGPRAPGNFSRPRASKHARAGPGRPCWRCAGRAGVRRAG